MFNFQSAVNPMKEVRAYIQPLALGSLLQNLDDIPDFPVTVTSTRASAGKTSDQVKGRST
jgi:hypothetical protein